MSRTENEQPTLSHAELVAADIVRAGGDARQARLRELDRIAKAREADAATVQALLAEVAGDPEGQAEIADREARIRAANAEREAALDAIAAEKRGVEAAYVEGHSALAALGDPNARATFAKSPQGKDLETKAARLRAALQAAGDPDRQPPEAVAKLLAERGTPRSQAHRAFDAKVSEVAKALGVRRPDAFAKAKEAAPELWEAAARAPLDEVTLSVSVAKVMNEIAKAKGATRSKVEQASRYLAAGLPWVDRGHRIAKEAASLTLEELMAAIALLTPEQADQVRRLLDEPGTKALVEKYRPRG